MRSRSPTERGNFERGGPLPHCAVIFAKMAEAIEMLCGLWAWMGQRNHGVQIHYGKGQFLGKRAPIVKYRDFLPWAGIQIPIGMGNFEWEERAPTCPTTLTWTVQKRLNRSRCRLRTLVDPRKHVLDGSCEGAIITGKDMPDYILPWAMQKWLNRTICHLCNALEWAKGSTIWLYSPAAPMWPHGRADWRHLANTIEPPVCGGDVALCLITLTTCLY